MKDDIPLCFCNEPSHRSFTLEYGPSLECSGFVSDPEETTDDNKSTASEKIYTCGFHVHEESWLKLRYAYLHGETIEPEHPELRDCLLYNFTYCVSYFINNPCYKQLPSTLPHCFCEKPVELKEVEKSSQYQRHSFVCSGDKESGEKCSWQSEAKELAFPREKYGLHTHINQEAYHQYWTEMQSLLISPTSANSYSLLKSKLPDIDFEELINRVIYLLRQKNETENENNQSNTKKKQESDGVSEIQTRMSFIEIHVQRLLKENRKLAEEVAVYGSELDNLRCKVCYENPLTHCLAPCLHLAYCRHCVIQLKECAFCRKPITRLLKVYHS